MEKRMETTKMGVGFRAMGLGLTVDAAPVIALRLWDSHAIRSRLSSVFACIAVATCPTESCHARWATMDPYNSSSRRSRSPKH